MALGQLRVRLHLLYSCLWNYSATHIGMSPETLMTCAEQVTAYIAGTTHINVLRSGHSPAPDETGGR
jgi:hypothetical protein